FRRYDGGDLLLFATAPWSLYAMRWAGNKPPILCLTISLLSAAVLFFTKLTGLIVFATNVIAISLLALVQRRLSSSIITMWVASAIGALCFILFWIARGAVQSGSGFTFSWFPIWFSVTGAAFSGIFGLGLFLGHPWLQINLEWATELLGALGLLLIVWVWRRLRRTSYHDMAVLFLAIILMHAIIIATMYLRESGVSFEDRHFRYAGILFFLLLLTAVDEWGVSLAKGLTWSVIIVLGLFGLKNYVTFAYAQMRTGYYDPMSGITQDIVSPAILEYMRSEAIRQNFNPPIAVEP